MSGWQHKKARLNEEWRKIVRATDVRLWFFLAIARLLPRFTFESVRALVLRGAGCAIGKGVGVEGCPVFVGGKGSVARLHIASGSIIGTDVTFGLDADINIGANVAISPHVIFTTATHAVGSSPLRRMAPAVIAQPITIGDGTWICIGSLILPGVTIGPGCVVSAGAVVTSDMPANSLISGNPAVVQRTLPARIAREKRVAKSATDLETAEFETETKDADA